MNEPQVSFVELIAYVDGELGSVRRAEIDQTLSVDESLRQQLQSILAVRQRLTAAWGHNATPPVPSQRIWARLETSMQRRTCWQQAFHAVLCVLAALVALCVATLPCVQREAVVWWQQWQHPPSVSVPPPIPVMGLALFSPESPACDGDLRMRQPRIATMYDPYTQGLTIHHYWTLPEACAKDILLLAPDQGWDWAALAQFDAEHAMLFSRPPPVSHNMRDKYRLASGPAPRARHSDCPE